MRDAVEKVTAQDFLFGKRAADGVVAQAQELDRGVVGVEALQGSACESAFDFLCRGPRGVVGWVSWFVM